MSQSSRVSAVTDLYAELEADDKAVTAAELKRYLTRVENVVKRLKQFADPEATENLKHWEAVLGDVKNILLNRQEAEATSSKSDC